MKELINKKPDITYRGGIDLDKIIARIEKKYTLSSSEKQHLFSKLSHCKILGLAETSEGGFSEDGEFHMYTKNKFLGQIRIKYFCPSSRQEKYLILKKYKEEVRSEGSEATVLQIKCQHLYKRLLKTALLYERIAQSSSKIYFKRMFHHFYEIHKNSAELLKNNMSFPIPDRQEEIPLWQWKIIEKLGKYKMLQFCRDQENEIKARFEEISSLSVSKTDKTYLRLEIEQLDQLIIASFSNLLKDSLSC